jgi:hypothetical protein
MIGKQRREIHDTVVARVGFGRRVVAAQRGQHVARVVWTATFAEIDHGRFLPGKSGRRSLRMRRFDAVNADGRF